IGHSELPWSLQSLAPHRQSQRRRVRNPPKISRFIVMMKVVEVNRCQIQEWYPKFKSCSIPTIIHQLPECFIDYLLDSGTLQLPVSVTDEDALPNRVHNPIDEEDYQLSEEASDDEAESGSTPPCFPELELKIKKSIEALGGAVLPKLNWSAPKDSAWISSSRTLRCTSFSEIALLLKSSDSLVHDLSHAYDSCSDKLSSRPATFHLALRRWYSSLLPEREFRCFVRRGQHLVGISQREVTTCYPLILAERRSIRSLIREFFDKQVRLQFESDDYTFDVYVTNDGRVKILDFNPWGAFTLPLLFTWEELEQVTEEELDGDDDGVELRAVETRCGIRPGLKTAVPQEFLDAGSGSGWEQVLKKAFENAQVSDDV
ncbi:Cell division cycle protein 123 homolog, partial [Linum grandiflorum]